MTTDVQDYVLAADRDNTVRSYAAALRNFETVWKGMLPATVDTVARYLAEHASIYRLSTLRLHLAALARWHADNGFADPTRAPLVHKVLRGVRAKHATAQRRARPLQLDVLEAVSDWLGKAQASASKHGRRTEELRRSRDRSLLLLGFWRAFRADELANMRIEEVVAVRGTGLTCRPRAHQDHRRGGRSGVPLPGVVAPVPSGCLPRLVGNQRADVWPGLPWDRSLGQRVRPAHDEPGCAAAAAPHTQGCGDRGGR